MNVFISISILKKKSMLQNRYYKNKKIIKT